MNSKMNIKSIVILAIIGIVSLFFINMSLAASTGTIIVDTANLRETPDEGSKILELLSMNQKVEIIEKTENWYKVKTQGITGYLREDLLTLDEQPAEQNNNNTVSNNTDSNNTTTTAQTTENNETIATAQENTSESGLRYVIENTKLKIVPVINATDIIEVKKDEQVNIIEEINGWVCVEIGRTKGWIRQEKLQKPEERQTQPTQNTQGTQKPQQPAIQSQTVNKTLYIKSASVNMRKDSNTSSEVVTTLTINTAVTVTEELSNGWSKVQVNGNSGYILSSLLSTQKQETSRSQSTPRQATTQTTTTNTASATQTTKASNATATASVPSGKGATVVETAKKYLGCKYVYGGTTPNGFDCSGFTSYVFKLHGISISRTSQAQYKNGVAVSKENLQPGDLVFFYKGISHVGIYIGGGNFIHAANTKQGVIISTLMSGNYCTNYAGARRVM